MGTSSVFIRVAIVINKLRRREQESTERNDCATRSQTRSWTASSKRASPSSFVPSIPLHECAQASLCALNTASGGPGSVSLYLRSARNNKRVRQVARELQPVAPFHCRRDTAAASQAHALLLNDHFHFFFWSRCSFLRPGGMDCMILSALLLSSTECV